MDFCCLFRLVCVHIVFSSFWVAEWPPFWERATQSAYHTLSLFFSICNFSYSNGYCYVNFLCISQDA